MAVPPRNSAASPDNAKRNPDIASLPQTKPQCLALLKDLLFDHTTKKSVEREARLQECEVALRESRDDAEFSFLLALLAAANDNLRHPKKAQSLFDECARMIRQKPDSHTENNGAGSAGDSKNFEHTTSTSSSAERGMEVGKAFLEMASFAPMATATTGASIPIAKQALKYFERSPPSAEAKTGTAQVYTIVGYALLEKGKISQGDAYLERAMRMFGTRHIDSFGARQLKCKLIERELNKGNYQRAEKLCNELIAVEKANGYHSTELIPYINQLVNIYERWGRYTEAEAVYPKWKEELQDCQGVYARLLRAYYAHARDQGDADTAKVLLQEAVDVEARELACARSINAMQTYAHYLNRNEQFLDAAKATRLEYRLRLLQEKNARDSAVVEAAPRATASSARNPVPQSEVEAQNKNVELSLLNCATEFQNHGRQVQQMEIRSIVEEFHNLHHSI